jgi:hypothetical protein
MNSVIPPSNPYMREIAVGLFTIFGALIGIIYHNIVRRIEKCEKDSEVISGIASDVKHIMKHCSRCDNV